MTFFTCNGRCRACSCLFDEPMSAIQKSEPDWTIEQQLIRDQIKELFTFKILLLGAGESGKSTIVKQLRLIHNKKLMQEELNVVAQSLHQNTLDCMKALLQACRRFGYSLNDHVDEQTADVILHSPDITVVDEHFANAILKLCDNHAMRQAYARRNEFWLLDAVEYYLRNLLRFAEPDFVPTEEDAIRARIRTTGIIETFLEEKRPDAKSDEPDFLTYQIVDVGGQRNERKKWIHCFSDVKCILFIVSLAGYDQVLFEDPTKNRMHEALDLFQQVCSNPLFKNTPIFLFLNKKDLFEAMIMQKDLSTVFPDYAGGTSIHAALEFIRMKFRGRLPAGMKVDIQEVTGVFKRDIKCAFEEVKKVLTLGLAEAVAVKKSKITKNHSRQPISKRAILPV